MKRPYIFCHMMTSLDGKIIGPYMKTKEAEISGNVFYDISFGKNPYYKHQGWLSGRVTTDDNFTNYELPSLDEKAPEVPEGDFIVSTNEDMYYISIDPSGRLGWKSNILHYIDTSAHVIEVLTAKASNEYKAFLRGLNIPYIIAADESLNYPLLMEKLVSIFGINNLMLGGGGVLNWSFIQAGLCDELSLLIAPVADGSSATPTLFESHDSLGKDIPVGFSLEHMEVKNGDSIWLRYKLKKS